MRKHKAVRILGAALFLVVLSSCGSSGGPDVVGAVTGGGKVSQRQITLPSQILGLQVKAEDLTKQNLAQIKRPYLDNVGLFSLREGELVRATFQVSSFNAIARPDSGDFRASIIGLLGSSKPERVRVQEETVYVTTGNEQNIFVWFKGKGFFVLTAHSQYEFPRTLLRRIIEVEHGL